MSCEEIFKYNWRMFFSDLLYFFVNSISCMVTYIDAFVIKRLSRWQWYCLAMRNTLFDILSPIRTDLQMQIFATSFDWPNHNWKWYWPEVAVVTFYCSITTISYVIVTVKMKNIWVFLHQWTLFSVTFLSAGNNRETKAAIEVNNGMHCLQKRIEKFPLMTVQHTVFLH